LLDLCCVLPLKERVIKTYGSQVGDTWSLMTVFNSNQGYRTCKFPMVPVEGGVGLNTQSRFFLEDIPYGLCILKDLAQILGVATPNIDKQIRWHQRFMDTTFLREDGTLDPEVLKQTGCPSRFGITTPSALVKIANFDI